MQGTPRLIIGYVRDVATAPASRQAAAIQAWVAGRRLRLVDMLADERYRRDDGQTMLTVGGIARALDLLRANRARGIAVACRAAIEQAPGWSFDPEVEIGRLARALVCLDESRRVPASIVEEPAGRVALCGPMPFGYRRAGAQAVPVPDEAAVVRLIFALYRRAGASIQRVADELNGRGHQTSRGRAWTRGSVAWVLRNAVYGGVSTASLAFPALVSAACRQAVADRLREQDCGVQ